METHRQSNLHEKVLELRSETSGKYVPEPLLDEIIADTLTALKKFKNNCRWKEYWRLAKETFIQNQNKTKVTVENNNDLNFKITKTNNYHYKHTGLNTGLKPSHRFIQAPKGSDDLKFSLKAIERTILNYLLNNTQAKTTPKDENIHSTLNSLCNSNLVAIPIDKTNSIQVVEILNYKTWMQEHINNSTIKIPRDTIQQIFKNAVDFANTLEPLLSRDKKDFLKEGIESKAKSKPKLIIKDHKQKKN